MGDFEKYCQIETFGTKERGKRRHRSTLQSPSQYCKPRRRAAIAPAVERTLGKGEVACSNHAGSTILFLFINIFTQLLMLAAILHLFRFTLFIHF
jgi:hypothetical protein